VVAYLGHNGTLPMGIVGLVLTYAYNIDGTLGWICQQMKQTQMDIVAVERISEYINNVHEAEWYTTKSLTNWPNMGSITFKNFSLRYRANTELVLRNLHLQIKGGEKVAVVGRTGAGKSSLTLALFRIVEGCGGTIEIDDEDITKIGLHQLRRWLTIIPQDPVVFSGTVRMNLDPFDMHTDEELWLALDRAHLKGLFSDEPERLNYEITDGGGNLSVGQRQLLCLARALLKSDTRILVLDEATAAVDVGTDALIQASIRTHVAHVTIVTIAHRLSTIMDYDRVVVMQNGQVVEFDAPQMLINRDNSLFRALAKDAGLVK